MTPASLVERSEAAAEIASLHLLLMPSSSSIVTSLWAAARHRHTRAKERWLRYGGGEPRFTIGGEQPLHDVIDGADAVAKSHLEHAGHIVVGERWRNGTLSIGWAIHDMTSINCCSS